ncbi:YdeI/OmpD-associated family protein [Hymenobacter negativus]|uniref:YdeI/OmpD-associated family protein n=1 Tax=Hymenobacter negativus TaxID=2795026 RepID=A0ABS3QJP1_9BACT|nr:YdeI/OmpD-associated family protein [Hymenobacter negativus]MBO2011462.1 YdeI/OmpD-associated family protein [Hymenobacter negativus]
MNQYTPNPDVDFYFDKAEKWQKEQLALRRLVLDCGLIEELKWGVPCYNIQQGNVVLIHAMKQYCALLFLKGVLLQDASGILVQQTENTQAQRQIRFASMSEIVALEPTLRAYLYEAIEIENLGLQVRLKSTSEFAVSAEFQRKLNENPALQAAFEALTPGRQRGYLLHFSSPKQAKTREARVEKWMPHILSGKGLNE